MAYRVQVTTHDSKVWQTRTLAMSREEAEKIVKNLDGYKFTVVAARVVKEEEPRQ